jgi:hypothetical protein
MQKGLSALGYAGEGWQWQIGSPPCSHSSSCSGQKQKAPDGGRRDQYEKEQRLLERIQ